MPKRTAFNPRPPSLQARLARRGAELGFRPIASALPDNRLGVAAGRVILSTMMGLSGRQSWETAVTPIDSEIRGQGRVKGEWVLPPAPRPGGVVLYLHGSGYNLCSTRTHRPLVSQFASHARLRVFSAEYRLAPDHVFPAAHDDVARAYRWLLDQGCLPHQIVLAGDSAGGHLALDLALTERRAGRPLPAALVLFSPLADPSFQLAELREQARPDPLATAAAARALVARYLVGTDPAHPRLTHVLEDGEHLPPTLIQAGGAEMLAADAHHLHRMLSATGTETTLEIWPGQMHVFQAAPRIVPEAHQALRRATRFAVEALRQAQDGGALAEATRTAEVPAPDTELQGTA